MAGILLIDNYDSFTYNLVHLVKELGFRELDVVRNDKIEISAVAAAPQYSNGFYYTVQWGDNLSRIAVRYGTTVHAILAVNPQIYNPNYIYYGQVIFIPQGPVTPPPPPPPKACRYYHYVTYGQNLSSIAAWYGVSPWAIAQANGLYNLNYIYAGTYLCIP